MAKRGGGTGRQYVTDTDDIHVFLYNLAWERNGNTMSLTELLYNNEWLFKDKEK